MPKNCGLSPREYLIEEYTRTVCPDCFAAGPVRADDPNAFVDGMLVSHDDRIWMRRFCVRHGETESLYEEDLALWRARGGWSTPTLGIEPDRPGNAGGFPAGYRDGLPVSHGQHTCILVLNLTERCNYSCPTCYASAQAPGTPLPAEERPAPDEVVRTVETVLQREGGRLGVVMLSGGEPTVRRDLVEIMERLFDLEIGRVLLNTNGRRVARDDRFLEFLRRNRRRVEVYLQFDALSDVPNRALRGEDLVDEKLRTLQRLDAAGVYSTLVATVARGVNENEIGTLAEFALDTPHCAGLAIQPAFVSGRSPAFDPQDRVTPTGILRRLEQQTAGRIQASDFIPLPCSHRDCCDLTYLLKTDARGWQSIPRLIGRDALREWVHLIANTINFDAVSGPIAAMVRSGSFQRVFSEQLSVASVDLSRDVARMCDCIPGLPQLLGELWRRTGGPERAEEQLAQRTFRITVKQFMDAHTFHEARIRQCCVHVGTFEEDPRRYSFCWRWLFDDAVDRPAAGFVPLAEVRA